MAGEMLILARGGSTHILSSVSRLYERSYEFSGAVSRAITGKLNLRRRALKSVHAISWDNLPYEDPADGGLGLADLVAVATAGGEYELTVRPYPGSHDEEVFAVVVDPESIQFALVEGFGREFWAASIVLLEV